MGKLPPADVSLIRDPDLLAELEAARGKFAFDVMASHIVAKQQKRDADAAKSMEQASALAALPREKRRRAAIRAVFESQPPTVADIRHIHSILAICGLPSERTAEREHSSIQGNMGVIVQAGSTLDAAGKIVHQPLPFGPKARLILMHLCSEAIRQDSPTIEIADTFTAFVKELGFSTSGGKKGPLTAFREQLNALAMCSIRIVPVGNSGPVIKQFFPIEEIRLWLSTDPDQQSLWPSTVTFSPQFFQSLKKHALPVNRHAIRAIQGSARKLDLYFWLGWRMYNINTELNISWDAMRTQFGANFKQPRDFKAMFKKEILQLKEIFPRLPIDLKADWIVLKPADPRMLQLPKPRKKPDEQSVTRRIDRRKRA